VRWFLAPEGIRVIKLGDLIVCGQGFCCGLTVNAPDAPPSIMSLIVERILESIKTIAQPAPNFR